MKKDTTHNLTVAAMLSAVAFILMFIEFPIPMLIPAFIKMDFSDLPALLGAFALGPVYGCLLYTSSLTVKRTNTRTANTRPRITDTVEPINKPPLT